VWVLVAMAFFAVIREGLETAVFLLAVFQASGDSSAAGGGALLGILVAAGLGWGIYRGAVRINVGRFFRVTSVALVLVAAGLLMAAVHTAHEGAWFDGLQGKAVDLSWLLFAVPMLVYVLWPARRTRFHRARPVEAEVPAR
jgi:high-affinity iron transporter